jgi:hypothetical protein
MDAFLTKSNVEKRSLTNQHDKPPRANVRTASDCRRAAHPIRHAEECF